MKIKLFLLENKSLIFVLVVAAILRLWNLNINPSHLSPDEASLGYNAYSILRTGKDEYGEILPIIFKSFGDYKPGTYVYLTVPFMAIFGLNEWSVRLPSATAGVITVYLVYLIVHHLHGEGLSLDNKKDKQATSSKKSHLPTFQNSSSRRFSLWASGRAGGQSLPIIASFLLAVSPWHIHFSRGAWEINVSLTLTLLGVYFFLRALVERKYFILSAVSFSLTFITYQGAKLSTLIVVVILMLIFYGEIIKFVKVNLKTFIISILLSFFIVFPSILSFGKGQTGRLKVFSVFSYPRTHEYLENFLSKAGEKVGDFNYYIFHSEALNFGRGILAKYFNHFSPRFLFFEGDYQNPKHSLPNHGMLLLFDIILLPIGVIGLVRNNSRLSKFVFLWLFLSPLPAVLSRDQVQAVRAYNMVIPLTIVSSFGGLSLINYFNKLRYTGHESPKSKYIFLSYFLFTVHCSLFTVAFIYFLDSYFIHLPIHNAKYWNYGYKQVVLKLLPIKNEYQQIFFQESYNQPYIYFLFYGAALGHEEFEPAVYQQYASLSFYLGPDVGLVEKIDKIDFKGWSWPYATGQKSTLLIGDSIAIPGDFNKKDYKQIYEIMYPDEFMTAYRILETTP